MEAIELAVSGWPELIGGAVAAPGTATCNDNEYDFFVISAELEGMVGSITAHVDTPNGPHVAVTLTLRGCWKQPMVQTQRVPKGFELEFGIDSVAVAPT